MGRRAEHLHKRGTKWYLRVRVPDDLRPIVGKGEVWRSLRTSDASLARNLVRAESLKVSAEFDEARRKLRAALPSTAKATPVDLTDAEVWQLVARFFASAERRASAPLSPEAVRAGIEELSELEDYEGAAPNVYRHVGAILKEAGIANPTDGPALSHGPGITRADGSAVRSSTAEKAPPWLMKLHFGVHAALVESGRRHLNRSASYTQYALNPEFAGVTSANALKPVSRITFAELTKRYEADRSRAPLSPKAEAKRKAQLRFLADVVGARTMISDIDREMARLVFNTVCRIPSNATKRFPGKSIPDLLAMPPEKLGRTLSSVTANGYMILFGSVLSFAVAEQLTDRNPAERLRVASDGIAAKDRRLPLSIDDLRRLFAAPLYTGCQNDGAGYGKAGPERPKRARFWVPLLSLFAGMRMTECLQLTEDDVQTIDGCDVILVRPSADGKRVKSAAGIRTIPIHSELKRIGFLQLVAKARATRGSRLFPEQTPSAQGEVGSKFSKWFAHMLDSVGVTHDLKNLHSCRHAFRDRLRDAGVSAEISRALGGWANSLGSTDEIYGSGFRPSVLAAAIEKIEYAGLDLAHLYTRADVLA